MALANITQFLDQLGQETRRLTTYSAGNQANAVSAGAQASQGAFNQGSANIANQIGDERTAAQYAFNSAQAAMANDFSNMSWQQAAAWNEGMWDKQAAWNEMMWDKTAQWNEKMWQKNADYNSAEALKNRQWQEMMRQTAYQTAVQDMQKAGLNPILAVNGGGISAGGGAGSAASVGMSQMSAPSGAAPSMGAMSGQGANGGLMNGVSASVGNYTGQMDTLSGYLGLVSAAISSLSSAMKLADEGNIMRSMQGMMDGLLTGYLKNRPQKHGTETHKSDSGHTHGGGSGTFGIDGYGFYH